MNNSKEYLAFISYRHTDIKWAEWLQNKLEFYRLPSYIQEENPESPKELRPIFRDVTDLQLGELSVRIREAIKASHFLIVICSKDTPESKYVNEEVSYFLNYNDVSYVIPFIVNGTPNSIYADDECFPEALRMGKEILAANVNEYSKDYAAVKVVSRLLGGIEIHRLWDRYQAAEEEERKRLLETNKQLRALSARASVVSARSLVDEGNKAIAAKIALLNLPQGNDDLLPVIPEAEYLLRMSTIETKEELHSLFSFDRNTTHIDMSPNGLFLVRYTDYNFWLIDCFSGQIVHSGRCLWPSSEYQTLLFSDDCSLFLSSDTVRYEVFDLINKQVIAKFCIKDLVSDWCTFGKYVHFIKNEAIVIITDEKEVLEYSIISGVLRTVVCIGDSRPIKDWFIHDKKLYLLGVCPVDYLNINPDDEATERCSVPISTIDLRDNQFVERDHATIWAYSPLGQFILSVEEGYIRVMDKDFNILSNIDTPDFVLGDGPDDSNMLAIISDLGVAALINKQCKIGYIITKSEKYCINKVKHFKFSSLGLYALFLTDENQLFLVKFSDKRIKKQLVFSDKKSVNDFRFSSDEQAFIIISGGLCEMVECDTLHIIGTKLIDENTKLYPTSIPFRFIKANDYTVSVVEWNSPFCSFKTYEGLEKESQNNNVTDYFIKESMRLFNHSFGFNNKSVYYLLYSKGELIPLHLYKAPDHMIIMSSEDTNEELNNKGEFDLKLSRVFFSNGFVQCNTLLLINTSECVVVFDLLELKELKRISNFEENDLKDVSFIDNNTLVYLYSSNITIFSLVHETQSIIYKINAGSYSRIRACNEGRLLIECTDGSYELLTFSGNSLGQQFIIQKETTSLPFTLINGFNAYYLDGKIYDLGGDLLFSCENPIVDQRRLYGVVASVPCGKPFIIYEASYEYGFERHLRIWSIYNGRLIYEAVYSIDDANYIDIEIEYDVENDMLHVGDYFYIPFPPLNHLKEAAEKKYNMLVLSDDIKTDYYLQ